MENKRNWLNTVATCDYVHEKAHRALLEKCSRIGQMLGTMMAKPEKFCKRS
jgi:hypothetical protein